MPRQLTPPYTYTLPVVYLAVPGTTILVDQHNTPLEDIANTFNTVQPINYGGTGASTAAGAQANLGITPQDQLTYPTATGTGNAIVVTNTNPILALANRTPGSFKALASNTGAATVNMDGLGVRALRKIVGGTDVDVATGDVLAAGLYQIEFFTAANSGSGAWVLAPTSGSFAANSDALAATSTSLAVTPANLAQERQLGTELVNFGLAASVGSSALTVSLVGVNGSAPSSTNPVTIPFRNGVLATGTPSYLVATAATTIVISSGSTMGFTSGQLGRLWVVAFNDAGTLRLGLINCLSGTSIFALRNGRYSSTAEGGAGGADSAQVIYTGTAVATKAMTILGYIEATETTAGTWATAPSTIKTYQPGDPLPGDTIGWATSIDSAVATGTGLIPQDDTIPQITEGTQFMSQAYTVLSGANVLWVQHQGAYANSVARYLIAAMFRDSTANALTVALQAVVATNNPGLVPLNTQVVAGSAGSTTFRIRAGSDTSGTITFNGSSGSRLWGGVSDSILSITELMA